MHESVESEVGLLWIVCHCNVCETVDSTTVILLCVCQNELVGGVTMGLTVGQRVTRVIVRDAAGKSCWDCSMLYGPPKCRAGSYPAGQCVNVFRSAFVIFSMGLEYPCSKHQVVTAQSQI